MVLPFAFVKLYGNCIQGAVYYIYRFDILVCVCLQNLLFYSPHTYTEHNCGGYLGSHRVNVTHSML